MPIFNRSSGVTLAKPANKMHIGVLFMGTRHVSTTHSTNSTALLAASCITGSKLPPALMTLKSWDILCMEEKTERCGNYHERETNI